MDMNLFLTKILASLAQLILISLPQNAAYIIGIFSFNKKKIDTRNFCMTMIISLASIFCIRLLPISNGIQTLLSMVLLIILGVYLLKFPIRKTILGVFFVFIVTASLEVVTLKVITMIFGVDGFNKIINDHLTYAFAGFPASLLLFVISLVVYFIFTKDIKRSSGDGETGEKIS